MVIYRRHHPAISLNFIDFICCNILNFLIWSDVWYATCIERGNLVAKPGAMLQKSRWMCLKIIYIVCGNCLLFLQDKMTENINKNYITNRRDNILLFEPQLYKILKKNILNFIVCITYSYLLCVHTTAKYICLTRHII